MGRRVLFLVLGGALMALAVTLFASSGGEETAGQRGLVARFVGPYLAPQAAFARRIISPEFASPLSLRANERQIIATGPLGCEPGEKWRVDVVITQGDAIAKGHTQGHCSGRIGSWEVRAVARGPASFQAAGAHGCGTFTTRSGGEVTDTFNWCQDLVLESAG